MDYMKMWNDLKAQILKDKIYHEEGDGESIIESASNAAKCREILKYMNNLENGHPAYFEERKPMRLVNY